VRWYLRFGLSYRDLEELLGERGIEVDHVTLYRRVQHFIALLVDRARPARHTIGNQWFIDESYVRVASVRRYVYRAVGQHGQVVDVYVSARRDRAPARRFFTALIAHLGPEEVVTDLSQAFQRVIAELLPGAFHNTARIASSRSSRSPTASVRR
jgi:transposase-like protein